MEAAIEFHSKEQAIQVRKLKPRLKQINRSQIAKYQKEPVQLLPEDHEVRAILELVGRLDFSQHYKNIEVVEGNQVTCHCVRKPTK